MNLYIIFTETYIYIFFFIPCPVSVWRHLEISYCLFLTSFTIWLHFETLTLGFQTWFIIIRETFWKKILFSIEVVLPDQRNILKTLSSSHLVPMMSFCCLRWFCHSIPVVSTSTSCSKWSENDQIFFRTKFQVLKTGRKWQN